MCNSIKFRDQKTSLGFPASFYVNRAATIVFNNSNEMTFRISRFECMDCLTSLDSINIWDNNLDLVWAGGDILRLIGELDDPDPWPYYMYGSSVHFHPRWWAVQCSLLWPRPSAEGPGLANKFLISIDWVYSVRILWGICYVEAWVVEYEVLVKTCLKTE